MSPKQARGTARASSRMAPIVTTAATTEQVSPSITAPQRHHPNTHTCHEHDGCLPDAGVDFLPVHHVRVQPANPEAVDGAERPLVPDVEAVVQRACETNTRQKPRGRSGRCERCHSGRGWRLILQKSKNSRDNLTFYPVQLIEP